MFVIQPQFVEQRIAHRFAQVVPQAVRVKLGCVVIVAVVTIGTGSIPCVALVVIITGWGADHQPAHQWGQWTDYGAGGVDRPAALAGDAGVDRADIRIDADRCCADFTIQQADIHAGSTAGRGVGCRVVAAGMDLQGEAALVFFAILRHGEAERAQVPAADVDGRGVFTGGYAVHAIA